MALSGMSFSFRQSFIKKNFVGKSLYELFRNLKYRAEESGTTN